MKTFRRLLMPHELQTFGLKPVKPGDAAAQFVLTAMKNIYNNSIASANLNIKVSTSIESNLC
jgi:hypothetical protein